MYLISSSFDDFIIEQEGLDFTILKWCLSDVFKISLKDVLCDTLSPTQYADIIIHHHGNELIDTIKPYAWKKTLPKIILQSYLFDNLVRLAVFLRIAKLSENPDPEFYKLYASSAPFLLKTDNSQHSNYSGLGTFARDIGIYIVHGQSFFADKDVNSLIQLSSCIGDALTCDWILYKSLWQKLLLTNSSNLRNFRNFLHTYLVSKSLSEEELYQYFDIEKEDLESLHEDFINLCLTSKPLQTQIKDFFRRLSYYTDTLPDNFYYKTLFEGDYSLFSKMTNQEKYTQVSLS